MDENEKGRFGQRNSTDTSTVQRAMVTGVFKDRESAERMFNILEKRGYSKDDISVMMSDKTRERYFKNATDSKIGSKTKDSSTKAMEGAGTGSAIGGTLGAIVGAIAAIGTNLLIPGLGLVIAGPIAAALAGAGAGGITGGLIGSLIGLGVSETHAKEYEQAIKDGKILIGVYPLNDADAEFVEMQLRANNAESVHK